jgi:hypothetical protein
MTETTEKPVETTEKPATQCNDLFQIFAGIIDIVQEQHEVIRQHRKKLIAICKLPVDSHTDKRTQLIDFLLDFECNDVQKNTCESIFGELREKTKALRNPPNDLELLANIATICEHIAKPSVAYEKVIEEIRKILKDDIMDHQAIIAIKKVLL